MFVRVTRVNPQDGTESDVDYTGSDKFNLDGGYLRLYKTEAGKPDVQIAVIASGRWSAVELVDKP